MVVLSVDGDDCFANRFQRRSALQLASFEAFVADDVSLHGMATEKILFVDQPAESVVDQAEVIFCKKLIKF